MLPMTPFLHICSPRELQKLIKSSSSPSSSPFHQSHAAGSTDVTVYPPPTSSNSNGEPDKKKRKREVEETNDHVTSDTQHARFPNVFHANNHLISVHEALKKECEQLVELTVGSAFRPPPRCSTSPRHLGQG
jgi:proteasome activator subunit 3 (PA28 gamma)